MNLEITDAYLQIRTKHLTKRLAYYPLARGYSSTSTCLITGLLNTPCLPASYWVTWKKAKTSTTMHPMFWPVYLRSPQPVPHPECYSKSMVWILLATWRLTYLITEENGPYDVFLRLRKRTSSYKWIDMYCLDCMSVWVAFVMSVVTGFDFYTWMGLSAGSMLINRVYEALWCARVKTILLQN